MTQQRYRFVKRYRSGVGAWDVGQIIDAEPDAAAWFNRDVPGCLEPVEEPKTKTRAADEPPHDRMVKAAEKRGG